MCKIIAFKALLALVFSLVSLISSAQSEQELVLELHFPSVSESKVFCDSVYLRLFDKGEKLIATLPYEIMYVVDDKDSLHVPEFKSIGSNKGNRWIVRTRIPEYIISNKDYYFATFFNKDYYCALEGDMCKRGGSLQSLQDVKGRKLKPKQIINRAIISKPDSANIFLIPMSEWLLKENFWRSEIKEYLKKPGTASAMLKNSLVFIKNTKYVFQTTVVINYMVCGEKNGLYDFKPLTVDPKILYDVVKLIDFK